MTIHIHNSRTNGGPAHITEHESEVGSAFVSLVQYELGYGANILCCEPNRVIVETEIMSTKDVVTFSGTEEEMAPLFKVAMLHQAFWAHSREDIIEGAVKKAMAHGLNTPLMLHLSAGFLLGVPTAKASLAAFMGLPVERLEVVKRMSLDDLCYVAQIFISEGQDAFLLLDVA